MCDLTFQKSSAGGPTGPLFLGGTGSKRQGRAEEGWPEGEAFREKRTWASTRRGLEGWSWWRGLLDRLELKVLPIGFCFFFDS